MSSYHDVHVTTAQIERTSIFDLPYGIELTCNRVSGWSLWNTNTQKGTLLGGEYSGKWLVVDVDGHVIVDSRTKDATPADPPSLVDIAEEGRRWVFGQGGSNG